MHSLRRPVLFIILTLLLSACASEPAPQGVDTPQGEAGEPVASTAPDPTATTSPSPTAAVTPDQPPAPTAPPTGTVASEDNTAGAPTEEVPTAASDASTQVPPIAVNGRTADGAYFMGREDAPLTLLDYSDFL